MKKANPLHNEASRNLAARWQDRGQTQFEAGEYADAAVSWTKQSEIETVLGNAPRAAMAQEAAANAANLAAIKIAKALRQQREPLAA